MIVNGKRCLLKAGSGATQQEPYNEVLASIIMERLAEVGNSRRNLYPVDDRSADVAEDVAYSGEDMER